MSPERWREIEELYHAALEIDSASRTHFLARAAATDEDLRCEVESLLAQNTSDQNLLDCVSWPWQYPRAPAIDKLPFPGRLREPEPATLEPSSDLENRFAPGTVLAARYRIVAPLGCGGMGEVYRATDLVLRQAVALKFLPASFATDPFALNRLYNEVRLARQISHPNVCRVYDLAQDASLRFLTMEYIEGEDLSSLLRRIGRVPPEKAIEIAHQLCAGVAAAHERGVLHRDLKPSNIMIDALGNVRITDFGLAVLANRCETHDVQSGTPPYMAPEQLTGNEVTVCSDVYSLGLVLCELFGGNHLFKDLSQPELLRRKLETNAAEVTLGMSVEPEIESAIRHCLETDPRKRPRSAVALAVELSGGNALAATIARGETPVPELVARAGGCEGLPVNVAVACFSTVIAALIIFALVAPRTGVLSRVRVDTPDALEGHVRDMLSSLDVNEGVKHIVAGFNYDMEAFRHHFDAATVYFWYRTSPQWMVPYDLCGVMKPGNSPVEWPDTVTTEWDGTGHLLYLKAVPSGRRRMAVTTSELWTRLFAAAGLQRSRFEEAESGWIPALGWETRASWTGTYPDAQRTPIRVEAAAWQGRPVYFEIVPFWRNRVSIAPNFIERPSRAQLAVLVMLFSSSALLAWRNVRLGRGDQRGAVRIAMFIFFAAFFTWMCQASHVPDIAEFTLITMGASWAGFLAAGLWTLYLALEPYARRRWPHVMISWSRILSGRVRDALVGGHVLIGTTFGAAIAALIAVGAVVTEAYSPPLPSYWVLSGTRGMFAHAFGSIVEAVPRVLSVFFVTFCCKVFFRKQWLAVPVIAALGFLSEPALTLTPGMAGIFFGVMAATYVCLLLRSGLVSLTVAAYVTTVVTSLPITPKFTASATQASVIILCGITALALFGFYTTLAGRRLLKFDF